MLLFKMTMKNVYKHYSIKRDVFCHDGIQIKKSKYDLRA